MKPVAPITAQIAGERRVVTILFADIAGFTSLAESLDPEEVLILMNECFDVLVPIVEKYGGSIDKFIGDEIMALFGAPSAHEDDPVRALRAALEMMQAQAGFNKEHKLQLSLHIGVNTGLAIAGGIGSQGRQTYSVIGDAVNVAFRIKSASQPGEILVGPDTHRLAAPQFTFETLAPVQVKGRNEPVLIYRLLEAKMQPEPVRGLAGLHSPMVGRQTELAGLTDLAHSLQNNRGSIALIVGEAGLGKSRLVAEWRMQAEAEAQLTHLRWCGGHCLSYGSGLAYHLVATLLRSVLNIPETATENEALDRLTEQVHALLIHPDPSVITHLAHLLSLPVGPQASVQLGKLEPQALQARYLETIQLILSTIAAQSPLVLLIEDFHWVDPSSAGLLSKLLPLIQPCPILLCFISRQESDTPGWKLIQATQEAAQGLWQEFALQRLTEQESLQLVSNLLSSSQPPDAVTQLVVQKADGNPLFIEELIRMLIDNGSLTYIDGQWTLTNQLATSLIPESLQGLLMERVDRLPAEIRQTLRVSAVIGRRFTLDVLETVLAQPRPLVQGQLEYLQASGAIRLEKAAPEYEFAFQNTLGQEAAYRSLLHQDRKQLHRQVGEALEQVHAGQTAKYAATLAHHFSQAETAKKALKYFTLAGDAAFSKYALPEAIEHYARAMELCQMSASREQSEPLQHIFTRLGRAYELSNRYQEAADTYLRVEHLAQEVNQQKIELSALLEHARLLSTPNPIFNAEESDRLCRRALELAQQLQDPASESRVHWIFLLALWLGGDSLGAIEHGIRSLELARAHDLKEQMAYTLHDMHRAYLHLGDFEQARASLEEARGLWRSLDNLPLLADSLASSADLEAGFANHQEALSLADEAYQVSRAIGNLWNQAYARAMTGEVLVELGMLDEGILALEESLNLAEQAGVSILYNRVAHELINQYFWLGALPEVEELSNCIMASLSKQHDPPLSNRTINSLALRIRIAIHRNELARAATLLQEAEQMASQLAPTRFFRLIVANIEFSLVHQRFEEACALSDEVIALASTAIMRRALSHFYFLKGQALLGKGDPEGAYEALLQAYHTAKTRHSQYFLPDILALLAELARQRGETAQAADYMQQAQQSVEYLLGNLSIPSPRAAFLSQPVIQNIRQQGIP